MMQDGQFGTPTNYFNLTRRLSEFRTAAIRLSTDGRFLYGSNRGHNSIAVYKVVETEL